MPGNITHKTRLIIEAPLFAALVNFATIFGFVYLIIDIFRKTEISSISWLFFAFILLLLVFMSVSFYTVNIRWKLSKYNHIPYHLHRINHIYRNSLSRLYGISSEKTTDSTLLEEQKTTLTKACDHISHIFRLLTGSECQVTIKLLDEESDEYGKSIPYCQTFTRNGGHNERDEPNPLKYVVKNLRNTAFETALVFRGSEPSHFWSADLTEEKDYFNDRKDFIKFYKSVIVVPVRFVVSVKGSEHPVTDDVGFISVDTKETYRLNEDSHVQLLASFADQVYNYLSILRGKYQINQQKA